MQIIVCNMETTLFLYVGQQVTLMLVMPLLQGLQPTPDGKSLMLHKSWLHKAINMI